MRALVLALGVALWATPALCHDDAQWIQDSSQRNAAGEWCCGKGDCQQLSAEQVVEGPAGWLVHGMQVTGGKDAAFFELVPYSDGTPSPDGKFWRCHKPDGSRRCWFFPPRSF